MFRTSVLGAAVAALLLVSGCSDSDPSGDGGGGSIGGGGTGGEGGAAPTIRIYGGVYELPGGAIPAPVTDGDVCFIAEGAADLCQTLDGFQPYEILGVPVSTVGAVRYRGPQISTVYVMLATASSDIELVLSIDTPANLQRYYDQTNITRDVDGVVVMSEIFPNPKADYAATLTPASGDGPFYYATFNGTLDLAATSTYGNVAMGVFLNVDRTAGPFTTAFTKDGANCDAPSYGAALPPWSIPTDADIVYHAFECP